MAVFTFIVKHSGGTWTAKQHGGEADLEASSASTWELQRKLTNLALTSAGSGAVSSSFSLITPTSAVAQVIFILCENLLFRRFMCFSRVWFLWVFQMLEIWMFLVFVIGVISYVLFAQMLALPSVSVYHLLLCLFSPRIKKSRAWWNTWGYIVSTVWAFCIVWRFSE